MFWGFCPSPSCSAFPFWKAKSDASSGCLEAYNPRCPGASSLQGRGGWHPEPPQENASNQLVIPVINLAQAGAPARRPFPRGALGTCEAAIWEVMESGFPSGRKVTLQTVLMPSPGCGSRPQSLVSSPPPTAGPPRGDVSASLGLGSPVGEVRVGLVSATTAGRPAFCVQSAHMLCLF